MAPVTLRTVTRTSGANAALKTGDVAPQGYHLEFEEIPVLVQGFRRMVRSLEFDVCEMALTTYLCAKEHGVAFTALPVFLVRGFHHGAILKAAGSPVTAEDLAGQRVGVNRGYTVTTGVWARGILATEYGVPLEQVTWVRSGDEHVAGYQLPDNVEQMPEGASLEQLVREGELAAMVGVESAEGLEPLLPHPQEAAWSDFARRGLYPINHLVVVRDEVLAAHPGVATALFEAFAAAKQEYVRRLDALDDDAVAGADRTDRMYRRVMDVTGEDPLPYGIAPNRAMLSELIDHAVRQQILRHRPRLADVFAAETLDLTA
ncbi:MAG: ABC transporter substrate-binding protein [Actinomycetes bacterium]